MGIDKALNENLIIGTSVGFVSSHIKLDDMGGRIKANSPTISLYSTYNHDDKLFIDAIVGYSDINLKNRRYQSENLTYSKRKASSYLGSIITTFNLSNDRFKLNPFIRGDIFTANLKAFSENENSLTLNYNKMKLHSQALYVGIIASQDIALEDGTLSPFIKLQYGKLQKRGVNQGVHYNSAPKTEYNIYTKSFTKSDALAQLGLDFKHSSGALLKLIGGISKGSNSYVNKNLSLSIRFEL